MDEEATIVQTVVNRILGRRAKAPDGYQVFTRKYDVVVPAADLDQILGQLGAASQSAIDDAWRAFRETISGWKIRAAGRALESAERVLEMIPRDGLKETFVCLLVDLSGSMRGEKLLLATAAVDCAHDYLGGLDISTEILGFTTRSWHGGRARRNWNLTGRPAKPGRLNELLHIVIKSLDDNRRSTEGWPLRQVFRPDLLKENIDGEAIEWAASRLRKASFHRKILVVLSDGAPVDDATLLANGPNYLDEHLRSVIAAIGAAGDIELAALGIGYTVSRYYGCSDRADTPSDIGNCLISLLERILTGETPPSTSTS